MNENPNIVDILLSRKKPGVMVDSSVLIKNVQNRINESLEKGYGYNRSVDKSEEYLRKRAFHKINMAVLYVDLVNSTKISMKLSSDKLSMLMSSFSQEMAHVINAYNGYVLKFVGDAVIGYFVEGEGTPFQVAENATKCSESMVNVVKQGINPVLAKKAGLEKISIRIGVDYGKNVVVRYGEDKKRSHVDLLGPTMNVASKIQNLANSNQILVGQKIYEILYPKLQNFVDITKEIKTRWQYYFEEFDEIYHVYNYKYEN